ncbi:hypothetical protein H257_01024 [Aphanomyces astaci]|uniref:Uncharacterized protein n=1 Tax=Aphanomyces astaci TaxID=112090 RepID=W4H841_APHAT|nr:hypothetical protein H257_01024 [Aphanomyces astaci]ETV87459.1 hypothetical protein H257_01024 [Aphanomyces astaci]|eukprot:XP_009822322.1 hypothetical protein H257_01024 [Aphanomyces astaci]
MEVPPSKASTCKGPKHVLAAVRANAVTSVIYTSSASVVLSTAERSVRKLTEASNPLAYFIEQNEDEHEYGWFNGEHSVGLSPGLTHWHHPPPRHSPLWLVHVLCFVNDSTIASLESSSL